MSPREIEILQLIRNNPTLTQNEIADKLNISRSTVAAHINNLIACGKILGRGYILRPGHYIAAVGACNMDILGTPSKNFSMRDSNPGKITYSSGGVCRNIVENMARLGLNISFITALGSDDAGDKMKRELIELGVDLSNSYISQGPSSHYLAIMDMDSDMAVAISDMDLVNKLDVEYLSKRREILSTAKYSIIDSNLSQESIEYLLGNISAKFLADGVSAVKVKKFERVLDKFEFLKLNALEAKILSGSDDILESGRSLITRGVKSLVITDGKNGAHYFDEENYFMQKPAKVKVKNTSGAGDAFMAAYIYALNCEYEIKHRLKFASAASALVLESESTSSKNFTKENIEEMYERFN